MSLTLRTYEQHDFGALHRLDQSCFPPGIAYSRMTLHYFLSLSSANCVVALEGRKTVGFILTEENPPLGHTITLDVAPDHRRHGIGSALLAENEKTLAQHGVRHILIETAIDNQAAVAFWQRHGYRIEAVLKRYYLGRLDAYEMRKILPAATTAKSAQKDI
jgi:ribosomal-protein-alanine N-acetyltransferase